MIAEKVISMKLESKSLINLAAVICFTFLLFFISKFILQGFGSINHLTLSVLELGGLWEGVRRYQF